VLDASFRTPPSAKMFKTAQRVPVTIFGGDGAAPRFPARVDARRVPADADGRLNLHAVLESLSGNGVTRVLVEGGPTIAEAFLAADLVDEVVIGRGTEALGSRGRKPLGSRGLEALADTAHWQLSDERMIGDDRLTVYRAVGRLDVGTRP
jgi:diaminohydroxyphosphoribosylaminopyrimidine deaminase/5-amino-6-(5-phosphoribosylamino)uracil reductase